MFCISKLGMLVYIKERHALDRELAKHKKPWQGLKWKKNG